MNAKCLSIILGTLLPVLAYAQGAQSYKCTYGGLERRVEILHETSMAVPCEVHYYKDTEAPGERQVLWHAANESGYCEKKTEEFIAKLEGLGWQCGPGGQPEAEPEPEAEPQPQPKAVDDTELLTPGDEAESDTGDMPD